MKKSNRTKAKLSWKEARQLAIEQMKQAEEERSKEHGDEPRTFPCHKAKVIYLRLHPDDHADLTRRMQCTHKYTTVSAYIRAQLGYDAKLDLRDYNAEEIPSDDDAQAEVPLLDGGTSSSLSQEATGTGETVDPGQGASDQLLHESLPGKRQSDEVVPGQPEGTQPE